MNRHRVLAVRVLQSIHFGILTSQILYARKHNQKKTLKKKRKHAGLTEEMMYTS